ncbi:unnamed protein product [Amoebophrya sp. A25]|nr:unnamed protein product [Amoebophrya sp. A25]|eukprot:GSA25T00026563001.1
MAATNSATLSRGSPRGRDRTRAVIEESCRNHSTRNHPWGGMLFGHSAGEALSVRYTDRCLTLEETMTVAYYRSLCGASTVYPNNLGGV